jgi:hypothetical protein
LVQALRTLRFAEEIARDGQPSNPLSHNFNRIRATCSIPWARRLFFMHFWANDDAIKLADGLRAALDKTAVAKRLTEETNHDSYPSPLSADRWRDNRSARHPAHLQRAAFAESAKVDYAVAG